MGKKPHSKQHKMDFRNENEQELRNEDVALADVLNPLVEEEDEEEEL